MRNGLTHKRFGAILATFFSVCAVASSLGMGNMVQANSISEAMRVVFHIPKELTGSVVAALVIFVVLGGIKHIAVFTSVTIPVMGLVYLMGAFWVIICNAGNILPGVYEIFKCAVYPKSFAGGLFGNMTVSASNALRWGVARGTFSNEAGLGAAGISAAAADTKDYIRQGYISMSGVFLDTIVICFITGLALAASGVVGIADKRGNLYTGTELAVKAFECALGPSGAVFVGISLAFFAFATIVAWAYQGEKAFEYLIGTTMYNGTYRMVYGVVVLIGAVFPLDVVWSFSDICNGLMAFPNLISVLFLSEEAITDLKNYEKRDIYKKR
jgi:AGCS family alanine or glycine:cation symporter